MVGISSSFVILTPIPPTSEKNGDFMGFTSSSITTDKEQNAKYGEPLILEDGISNWHDNSRRMRGFVPYTTGEKAYNIVIQGTAGQRITI